ncbi:branched-chain amino acid ABC transporter substrate-binding protein [Actinomycetospora sp. TBRC 11914]|uniref:branched-chain amino acid ABC transporter substrate-binding protein n=1 Tax=Actinomycetospora sp. TBRC 11914 TaxID=2729387 RepID=UPI00145E6293|nr:branched-chain amino acid ABC transporter substrate-binding protein [Actinomycetospora sp. TBRC 11914]NMO89530.1 branched-chain amino acid ABC transporter substrate-binding protein [Actinomycetospora sp. TBRC 11914]
MASARRTTGLLTVAVVAAALALAGCSSAGGAGGDCDTDKGTLAVGLIAPLSGPLANIGLGMRDSADLAVRQANERCAIPGYRLELQSRDDRGDPPTGAAAAKDLVADPDLIGVVGTYNSSTAQTVQPVLGDAGVVQVSPGNTNVSLTRGANPVTAPLRQYQTYFRVVASDAVQGPAAADHLAALGRTRVAVVSDGQTYGEGIADEFTKQFATRGGDVVLRTTLPAGSSPTAAVAAIGRSNPQAVFYGGEYPDGAPLSRALAGLGVPLMGGDGIVDPDYATEGGRDGDLGTSVGPPTETLPGAKAFLDAYRAAGYREGYGQYGAFSFDAANVVLGSAGTVVANRGGGEWSTALRPAVVQAVQAYDADGITGPISFDRFGDVGSDAVTMYRLVGGRWIPDRAQP